MTAARILKNKATETITIAATATIGEAVDILSRNNIGALVVSDDGKTIAGILSERDIIHGLQERGAALLDCLVGDCMTQEVQTCAPSATTNNLLARMTELRLRHLPVVGEDGQLVGIVSIGDVVKIRLDDLVSEVNALHGYITNG
tara:strand:+ start:3457 stop:3891 length:435 start_codon:yes stop_codon:yes gene_type:complete